MDIAVLLEELSPMLEDARPTAAEWDSAPMASPDHLRAALRYATAHFAPDLAVRAITLMSKLSPEEIATLLESWHAVDDEAIAMATDWEIRTWQSLLKHIPSLAPSLAAIHAHVLEQESACTACERLAAG